MRWPAGQAGKSSVVCCLLPVSRARVVETAGETECAQDVREVCATSSELSTVTGSECARDVREVCAVCALPVFADQAANISRALAMIGRTYGAERPAQSMIRRWLKCRPVLSSQNTTVRMIMAGA